MASYYFKVTLSQPVRWKVNETDPENARLKALEQVSGLHKSMLIDVEHARPTTEDIMAYLEDNRGCLPTALQVAEEFPRAMAFQITDAFNRWNRGVW